MLETLERDNAIEGVFANDQSTELRSQVEAVADFCTVEADNAILEGGLQ